MTTPNDYEPSDAEITRALGWDDAPDAAETPLDVADTPDGGEPQPQPVAGTPEPTPTPTPTPEPEPAPVPTYTPPAAPADPFQAARDAEVAQLRQQNQVSQINQRAQSYMNGLLGQGWDQQQAFEAAQQYAQNQFNQYQLGETQRVANEQAKATKAYELSNQYGVPVETLKAYNDPASMEQAAKLYKETTGRIKELESKVNTANKAPVQTFDSNRMTASGSTAALKLRYASDPNFIPTDAQLAQMGF